MQLSDIDLFGSIVITLNVYIICFKQGIPSSGILRYRTKFLRCYFIRKIFCHKLHNNLVVDKGKAYNSFRNKANRRTFCRQWFTRYVYNQGTSSPLFTIHQSLCCLKTRNILSWNERACAWTPPGAFTSKLSWLPRTSSQGACSAPSSITCLDQNHHLLLLCDLQR